MELKKIRDERSITQETLAELTGLSPGQISRIENGKSDFTGEFLETVARVLSVTPAELLGGIAPNSLEELDLLDIWRNVPWPRQGLFVRLIYAIATALEIAPEEEYKHFEDVLRKAREDLLSARRQYTKQGRQFSLAEQRRDHGVAGMAETGEPYNEGRK